VAKRRQTYNLDRQTKLFDLHKQFMGGLKTIDTDDALGSVFLRDVDNLSLSEFGFLEKRYGTYINEEFQFEGTAPDLTKAQGYFEYTDEDNNVHKILFVDGKAYIKNPIAENQQNRNLYVLVEVIYTEEGLDYPEDNVISEKIEWQVGEES
jgi:superfamily II DNA or RNA helicase